MAFGKSNGVTQVDGYRMKVVGVQAPSGDAHTTAQAFVFNGTVGLTNYGMSRPLVGTPTEFGITLITGESAAAKQEWSITAVSDTGFTIRKNTASTGAGVNCILLCWFRVPRGVGR